LLPTDGQRLGRAAIGQGVKVGLRQIFTRYQQAVKRPGDGLWGGLLAKIAAFQAQPGIKQHFAATSAALRVLTPAAT
jgi:hypothetical protein